MLAPALAGHAGGPALDGEATAEAILDAVERAMDEAGFETAHLAGNSLGGYAALRLAERGRARSVVALAPAGGWGSVDDSYKGTLEYFRSMVELTRAAGPRADAIASTPEGRRRATAHIVSDAERVPPELVAHLIRGAAACDGATGLIESALRSGYPLAPERVTCPVRFVWGTADRLLEWPRTAARYRGWFPHADWVELDGIGHCPQLDAPLETAELILGFTAP